MKPTEYKNFKEFFVVFGLQKLPNRLSGKLVSDQ